MSAMAWPLFLVAAAIGAIGRYELARRFSFGILAANIAGSFILGVLTGLASRHGLGVDPYLVLGAGFCGSLTTFSTVSVDVAERPGARWRYGLVTVTSCITVAILGLALV